MMQSRYAALEPIGACLMLCLLLVCIPGRSAPNAQPARSIKDVVQLLDQYQPDPAAIERMRLAMEQEAPAGATRDAQASFYLERSRVAGEAGALARQIADLHRVLELGGGPFPARAYMELSYAQFNGGAFQAALDANQQAIALTGIEGRGMLITDYAAQSEMSRRLGHVAEAKQALKDAEDIFILLRSRGKRWGDMQHSWSASYQDARGRALLAAGKLHEAEVAFREAIRERDLDLPLNQQRLSKMDKGQDNPPQARLEGARDGHELRLAETLIEQGRLFDAELHIRHVLQRTLSRVGRYSFQSAIVVRQYTRLLLEQRRPAEAEALSMASIDILQRIGVTPDSLPLIQSRRQLAASFVARGQWQQALSQYQIMQQAVSGEFKFQLAGGDINWALCLIKTGRADQAIAMLTPLLARSVEGMGTAAIQSAELRGYLGMALANAGQRPAALTALRAAVEALIVAQREGREAPSPVRQRRLLLIVDAYIAQLADIRGTPLEQAAGIDAAAEAFRMADFSRGQSVQQAVAQAAARSATTPELAELIRKSQDLRQEAGSLYRVLVDQMSLAPEKQLPKVIADMKARIADIEREGQALSARVTHQFPSYAELVSPKPATLEQARAALRPGEALLSIVSTEQGSYIWAVPHTGPLAFAASRLNQTDIAALVATLRSELDAGDADLDKMPGFDLDVAYRLYSELLAPVEAGWKGARNLLVSSGGALSQLPFALLPTAPGHPPAGKLLYRHLARVPWLIRQSAVTNLPSVNSLLVLRRQKPGDPGRTAFLGFGDPDFGGKVVAAAGVRGVAKRALARRASIGSEAGGDWIDYSRIPPLPDTRDEILALARTLGANPAKDVLLGAEASKSNLKRFDLSKRRIIAFATHGLLAGDFPGVDQPSLALANPGGGQNGLLTLEEILGLKLDADWVVLSACNTAAGDGAGAEALSGLGRAFFYAGSRSLLVTHWPVETVSARLLVTDTFARYAADATLSRAEALRQAMLALIDSPGAIDPASGGALYSYAHPMFWAPYVLVGDGGQH